MINFGRGKSFSQREVQVEACLACHRDDEGGTSVIEWYSSSHNRKNINCSMCHSVHEALDPMQDADQQVAKCNRCHRSDPWVDDRIHAVGHGPRLWRHGDFGSLFEDRKPDHGE